MKGGDDMDMDMDGRFLRSTVATYYQEFGTRMVAEDTPVQGLVTKVRELGGQASGRWEVTVGGPPDSGVPPTREQHERIIHAKVLVLACGSYDVPRKLGIPGEELPFVHHKLRALQEALPATSGTPRHPTSAAHTSQSQVVVVVGAGLSAADAILTLLLSDKGAINPGVQVVHVFRGPAEKTKIVKMFGADYNAHGMYSKSQMITLPPFVKWREQSHLRCGLRPR